MKRALHSLCLPAVLHARACSLVTAQSLGISAIADSSGSEPSSSVARGWSSRVYSTTGGQPVAMRGSKAPVAGRAAASSIWR